MNGEGVAQPASLNSSIIAGTYSFIPLVSLDSKDLKTALNKMKEEKHIFVSVFKKGKEIVKDIKPLIYNAELIQRDEMWSINTFLSMQPLQSCRPQDFFSGLLPDYDTSDFLIIRTGCYCMLKKNVFKNMSDGTLKSVEL